VTDDVLTEEGAEDARYLTFLAWLAKRREGVVLWVDLVAGILVYGLDAKETA
jgi:hypothetical protein